MTLLYSNILALYFFADFIFNFVNFLSSIWTSKYWKPVLYFFLRIFGNFSDISNVFDFGITVLPPKLSYKNKPILINQAGLILFIYGIIKGIGLEIGLAIL